MDLDAAHSYSSRHRQLVTQSIDCGCFFCLEVFPPGDITCWIDEQGAAAVTAQCPFCGVDSVLPSAAGVPITPEFLQAMKGRWFSTREREDGHGQPC